MSDIPASELVMLRALLERALREVYGCDGERQHHDNRCPGRGGGPCERPCWIARARALLAAT